MRAFGLFRLGGWTSDATAKAYGQAGVECCSSLPVNSEGKTSFAETASSISVELSPSDKDTSRLRERYYC